MKCFWICSAILLSKLQFTASSSPLNETEQSLSYLKSTSTSTTTTCQFSIGLFCIFDDNLGWNGDTATVVVNNVNVLQAVTLASGKGPALYNFIVSDSNPISVIYNPNGPDSYANSYAVYSGASGTGSVAYSSLPFFYNFTNPCTSITDPCFYSIKYNFNGGSRTENTLSLFVNRVAAFQNASLSSNETTKTINFNVVKGDPIQVLLYFPYSGGPLNYRYSLYTSANALGSSSYTFRIGTNGPATPAAIPNICSQNLSLTINCD